MEFDEVRRKVGSILGVSIPPNGFEAIAMERDTQGALAHKQLIKILIVLYTYLEHNAKTIQPTNS